MHGGAPNPLTKILILPEYEIFCFASKSTQEACFAPSPVLGEKHELRCDAHTAQPNTQLLDHSEKKTRSSIFVVLAVVIVTRIILAQDIKFTYCRMGRPPSTQSFLPPPSILTPSSEICYSSCWLEPLLPLDKSGAWMGDRV